MECSYGGKQWTFVEQTASSDGPQCEVVLRGRRTSASRAQTAEQPPISSLPTGELERHLRRTAFELEILTEFWDCFLPREDPDTVHVGGVYPAPWSHTFLELSNRDDRVKLALQACALLVRSRATGDQQFRRSSIRLYAEALGRTNQALRDSDAAKSDGVLAACRALANYEVLRGTRQERVSSQANDCMLIRCPEGLERC